MIRSFSFVTCTLIALSLAWYTQAHVRAGVQLTSSKTTVAMVTMTADDKKGFEYVGSNKCKKCHLPEYKSWEKTKKGHALETLKPDQIKDAKEHAKLDPKKDYSQDAACVKCHTTGFGGAHGYAIPDPKNEEAVKAAKNLEGVGCESCHGPGSGYLPVFEEIAKSKRKYKVDELYAAGMTKIEKTTCTTCHNEQSPTFDAAKPFDFDKMKEKRDQIHEKAELKQREN